MTYDPEQNPGEVDRLSYNPTYDYRTVDVDAWAEQWFSEPAFPDPNADGYHAAERMMYGQLHLHPAFRESDARDLEFGMLVLRSVGGRNPFSENAESADEQWQYQNWDHIAPYFNLIARQIVRVVLDDAEDYAAFRIEREQSGMDHLTGLANRLGLTRLLSDQYGITDEPMRRDSNGRALPAIKLTHLYADANGFKWINDTLGHHVGDAAIVEVAWRAKDFLRIGEAPIIYRHGGDEFGAILGGLGDYEIEQLTKRTMRRQVERVVSPEYKYRESRAAVEEAMRAVQESGGRVRAEARQPRLTQADLAAGKRSHYMLYINGEYVTELRNIIILSVGVASATVSTLEGVERLRRNAEADMERVRPTIQGLMDGEITIPPDTL